MPKHTRLKISFFKFLILVFVCLQSFKAIAQQHNLTIILDSLPAKNNKEDIFVAGNFNGWNPGDPAWKLKPVKNGWIIKVPLTKTGEYEFKFTRGGWEKVMCLPNGADAENYRITVAGDTTIHTKVLAWKDELPLFEKKHTLSKNVSVLDKDFKIPQLDRSRRIWLYLPANYKKSTRRYPVLYMHDAQNLFDEYTSGYGEWGIDETLDSLMKQPANECIVVGIENAVNRLTEYNPYDHEKFGKGEGDKYVAFIEKTLKLFIDKNYRTLKDPQHTMIAGSSMGGLISYYAALYHPSTFGKAGIFSPAFWTAPAIFPATDSLGKHVDGKIFFYIGGKEGDEHIDDMYKVMQKLGTGSSALMYAVTDAEGRHNEAAWRKWFPEFFKFMMADWTNYIIRD